MVVAEGPGGELLVGYRDADAGWRYDPTLGWVPVSVSAHLRRGMWKAPSADAAIPHDWPGDDTEPPDLAAERARRRAALGRVG